MRVGQLGRECPIDPRRTLTLEGSLKGQGKLDSILSFRLKLARCQRDESIGHFFPIVTTFPLFFQGNILVIWKKIVEKL